MFFALIVWEQLAVLSSPRWFLRQLIRDGSIYGMIVIVWSVLASLIYANPCHLPNLPVSRQKVCSQVFKFHNHTRVCGSGELNNRFLLQNFFVPRGIPQIYSKNRALPLSLAGDVFDCQDISCICGLIKSE